MGSLRQLVAGQASKEALNSLPVQGGGRRAWFGGPPQEQPCSPSASLSAMTDRDLTSLSDEELDQAWQDAMRDEDAALKAEKDYMRQKQAEARGRMPVMSGRDANVLRDAAQTSNQRRLAIEAEQQRRRP
jgi:hypothetical protein